MTILAQKRLEAKDREAESLDIIGYFDREMVPCLAKDASFIKILIDDEIETAEIEFVVYFH